VVVVVVGGLRGRRRKGQTFIHGMRLLTLQTSISLSMSAMFC